MDKKSLDEELARVARLTDPDWFKDQEVLTEAGPVLVAAQVALDAIFDQTPHYSIEFLPRKGDRQDAMIRLHGSAAFEVVLLKMRATSGTLIITASQAPGRPVTGIFDRYFMLMQSEITQDRMMQILGIIMASLHAT